MAALPSNSKKWLLLLLLLAAALASVVGGGGPVIGVTYRHHSNGRHGFPTRDRVVSALQAAGIEHAHIPDPTPATVRAFTYSGISLLLSVPASLASNRTSARLWLAAHVLPFHPRVRFAAISAYSAGGGNVSRLLLPAVESLRAACVDLGIRHVPVSATLSFGALGPALPPSAARFRDPRWVRPLVDYLGSMRSALMVELYPYEVYKADFGVTVGYAALFEEGGTGFRDDPRTGLRYGNLFDAMVDAVGRALGELGHPRMPVVVVETGWPSGGKGGDGEYGGMYNRGLVRHLRSGMGTPARREGAAGVYIRELFDEMTGGSGSEWGIWFANNLTAKYEMPPLSSACCCCCYCLLWPWGIQIFFTLWVLLLLLG